jgi:hypothetical protein
MAHRRPRVKLFSTCQVTFLLLLVLASALKPVEDQPVGSDAPVVTWTVTDVR